MVDEPSPKPTDAASTGLRDRWLKKVKRTEKVLKDEFREQADRAWDAFEIEECDGKPAPIFPIWWATASITAGALFSQLPLPDVRQRFQTLPGQEQPPGMDVLLAIPERLIKYTLDTSDVMSEARQAVLDYVVSGLGVIKIELESTIKQEPIMTAEGLPVLDEAGQPQMSEVVADQRIRWRYFSYEDFIWDQAKRWQDVDWVAFRHCYTKEEIRRIYGVDIDKQGERKDGPKKAGQKEGGVEVYEIWDKVKRRRIVLSECYDAPLSVDADPLRLQDFWPMPKPMMLGVGHDGLVPRPDYEAIKATDESIQRKTGRIDALVKQVKDCGFYDQQLHELSELMSASDGQLIPVKGLAERMLSQSGSRLSFDSVVAKQDNRQAVEVVKTLMETREDDKQRIYELLGISDIIRGATEAAETAKAQRIKVQFASVRLREKLSTIALMFREAYRIMAEIGAEHFTPDTLYLSTGIRPTPEQIDVLRSDVNRNMLIDVETDATIAQDEEADKEQNLELAQTFTKFAGELMPAIQRGFMPADMGKELLLMVLAPFKGSRALRDTVQMMPNTQQQMGQMNQQMSQMQQQIEMLQKQLQQAQQELAKNDEAHAAREDAKAMAEIEGRRSEAFKDRTTAELNTARSNQIQPMVGMA